MTQYWWEDRDRWLRTLTAVELNNYIVILTLLKHKNPHYSNGAKGKIFTFIATMHIYKQMCTVAEG